MTKENMGILEPEVIKMKEKRFYPWAFIVNKTKKFGYKKCIVLVGLCLTVILFFLGYFRSLENSFDESALFNGLQGGYTDLLEETIESTIPGGYVEIVNSNMGEDALGSQGITDLGDDEDALDWETLSAPINARPLPYVDLNSMVIPASGRMSAEFGWRENPVYGDWRYYPGVDIQTTDGALVLAAFAGRVKDVERKSLDHMIITIEHGGGISTIYSGVETVLVQPGEFVEDGQAIASMKDSGENLLYFQVLVGDSFIDPTQYL